MKAAGSPISRRTVAAGAVWTTSAVFLASAAPALAASGGTDACPTELPDLSITVRSAGSLSLGFRVVYAGSEMITLTPVSASEADGTILASTFVDASMQPLTQVALTSGGGWVDVDTEVPFDPHFTGEVLFAFTLTWEQQGTTCRYVYDASTRSIALA